MKNKFYFVLLIAVFVAVSIYKGGVVKEIILSLNQFIVNSYVDFTTYAKNRINEHFRQVNEIQTLREQNVELERSATLLSTFADQLNSVMQDKNSSVYEPNIKLIKALSYVHISDYSKIWMKFDEFNSSKIYGLIYHGKTAGIVVSKNNLPMGILQSDPKCTFCVYIGSAKIPGVAVGNGKNMSINFIPSWLEPKIGDEVFTSGLDGVFFSAVPVGKIIEILDGDLYKSAIVEPYAKLSVPAYLYVVLKE